MTASMERFLENNYSKEEINNIGKEIKRDNKSEKNLKIVTDWRSSHYYPLSVVRNRCYKVVKDIDKKALIAQRLKRFSSIEYKLKNTNYNLWAIQDIGGCRVIVNNIDNVYKFKNSFQGRSKIKVIAIDDYIGKSINESDSPKKSGYRGIHMICEYHSDSKNKENYNGMKIEIQVRTRYQHIWATTVETMDEITNQNLKSGKGNEELSRFFILASSLFCIIENCKLVPNTPTSKEEILKEMKEIDEKQNIIQTLEKYKVKSINYPNIKKGYENALSFYILSLDKINNKFSGPVYTAFNNLNYKTNIETSNSINKILDMYNSIEIDKEIAQTKNELKSEELKKKLDNKNSVLIYVNKKNLKETYPNYYLDSTDFVKIIKDEMKLIKN